MDKISVFEGPQYSALFSLDMTFKILKTMDELNPSFFMSYDY